MQLDSDPGITVEHKPAFCTRGMTRTGLSEAVGPEFQDAAAIIVKGASRGTDKMKDSEPTSHKPPKTQGKEAPRDMLDYTKKLSGLPGTEQAAHSLDIAQVHRRPS